MITATDNCHFQGYDLTTRYDLLVIYKSQTNYLPNVLTIIMRVADSLFILQTWDRIDKNSGLAILFLHHGKQVKLLSNWNQICFGLLNLFKCCLSFFFEAHKYDSRQKSGVEFDEHGKLLYGWKLQRYLLIFSSWRLFRKTVVSQGW